MNPTNRIYYETIVVALVIAIMAVSIAIRPAMAQTLEIPAYVQFRLEGVINDAAAQGDTIWIDKMDLNSIEALLDNKNHRVASAAAYALGEIRNPEAVPTLVAALKSENNHMRRIAAHALGKIGDRRAVMPLIEVLCNETQPRAVQASAIMSLGRIGDPVAKRIFTHLNRSSEALLDNKNHRVASAAAYALGEIRNPEAVPTLVASLKSENNHMRRIAAHALGKIGDRRAVMPLIEVLCNEKQPRVVQASAIMSLGRIGDPVAKRILTHLNRSSENYLQETANAALLKINAKQVLTLASAN